MTQNYLRLYLTYIADDTQDQASLAATNSTTGTPAQSSKGLLIHCISGNGRERLVAFNARHGVLANRLSNDPTPCTGEHRRVGSYATFHLSTEDIALGRWRSSSIVNSSGDAIPDYGIRLVFIQVSRWS